MEAGYTIFWLAATFGVHIAMVNLGIFLSLAVPLLKWRADILGDRDLEAVAYRLMRFYAATYAVAGVFGTAYTVFLLSFYPDFLGLAGHLTLMPFGIAILMIALHFLSITGFYYGWGRWPRRIHYAFGAALAVSSLLIPFGFRAVFAFLNIPVGLEVTSDGTLRLDFAEALGNPTFAPLYLKSITAAVAAGSMAVLGGLAYLAASGRVPEAAAGYVIRRLSLAAAVSLALMLPLGLWYALSLRGVPYKFNNIFASLGWSVGDGQAYFDVSWLFVVKMALYAFQATALALAWRELRAGRPGRPALLLAAGLAALATVVAGEYLNAFSQYPCFIAAMAGPEGCTPPDGLPERLAEVMDLRGFNELAVVPPVKWMTVTFMTTLTVATAYFFYVLAIKPGPLPGDPEADTD